MALIWNTRAQKKGWPDFPRIRSTWFEGRKKGCLKEKNLANFNWPILAGGKSDIYYTLFAIFSPRICYVFFFERHCLAVSPATSFLVSCNFYAGSFLRGWTSNITLIQICWCGGGGGGVNFVFSVIQRIHIKKSFPLKIFVKKTKYCLILCFLCYVAFALKKLSRLKKSAR